MPRLAWRSSPDTTHTVWSRPGVRAAARALALQPTARRQAAQLKPSGRAREAATPRRSSSDAPPGPGSRVCLQRPQEAASPSSTVLSPLPHLSDRAARTNRKGTRSSSPAPVKWRDGPQQQQVWGHSACSGIRPGRCRNCQAEWSGPGAWVTGSLAALLSSLLRWQSQHRTLVSGAGESAPSKSKRVKIEALFLKEKIILQVDLTHTDSSQGDRTT